MVQTECKEHEFVDVTFTTTSGPLLNYLQCRFCGVWQLNPSISRVDVNPCADIPIKGSDRLYNFPNGEAAQKAGFRVGGLNVDESYSDYCKECNQISSHLGGICQWCRTTELECIRVGLRECREEAKAIYNRFYDVNKIKDVSGTSPHISRTFAKECGRIYINGIIQELSITNQEQELFNGRIKHYQQVLEQLELL